MRKITKDNLFSKILITLAALVVFVYIGVAWYVQDLFLYGTRIGTVNASWMTVKEAEEHLQESLKSYVLTITGKDAQTAKLSAEDIGLCYDFDDELKKIKQSQNPMEWLPALFRGPVKYEADIKTVFDSDKLSECLDTISFLDPADMTAPKDAVLSYSEENGFSLDKSVEGNTIDRKVMNEKLGEALEKQQTDLNLEEEGCYLKPKVTEDSEEIRKMTDRLEAVSDFEISYAFGEEKEVIDQDVIWSWYRLDDDGRLVLKESAVRDYVSRLAKKYDTVGAARQFKTSKGKTIEVSGGPYGWMINQKKESEELLALVREKKSQKDRQPVYARCGFEKVRGTSDIGDTYIEISIEDQHMWYYEDGKLFLDTDVVTGKGGNHTKRGVAYIHNKARNATLVGPGYVSFVKYWMKVWNGIGIHDASWRNQFGGKIYLTNGSHGCINTPLDNVIKLYNQVEIGTPVVIY